VDAKQDWILSYSGEENGVTTLRFYRKPNTSDASDIVIQVIFIRNIKILKIDGNCFFVQTGSFGMLACARL